MLLQLMKPILEPRQPRQSRTPKPRRPPIQQERSTQRHLPMQSTERRSTQLQQHHLPQRLQCALRIWPRSQVTKRVRPRQAVPPLKHLYLPDRSRPSERLEVPFLARPTIIAQGWSLYTLSRKPQTARRCGTRKRSDLRAEGVSLVKGLRAGLRSCNE